MTSAANGTLAPITGSSLAEVIERLTARVQAGEPVDEAELLAEHPRHADELRRLLPAIAVLAELSASRAANGAAPVRALGEAFLMGELGDYRIVREAGRGGMAVVYEAEQISLRRRVALKVLPFAAIMDPRHLQRFKNEALAAASLDHQHVVKVYGVGCERGVHYIAMQFVDGQTLADLIRERRDGPSHTPVSDQDPTRSYATEPTLNGRPSRSGSRTPLDTAFVGRVTQWGIDAAEALEHAHALGIVHRDVKPGNLLVDGRGEVFVADFGLAKVMADPGVTCSGDMLGTLRYMSPEQAGAKHDLVDHRSDIYSLGVTLYELMTLTPPFEGPDRESILTMITSVDPVSPRKLDRAIPRDLETVILKAMDKDPARRYQSAKDLADDLRRFRGREPVRAKRVGLITRVGKWARRHRSAVAATSVAVFAVTVALLAGAAISIWQAIEADRARQLADQRLELTRRAADEMYTQVAEDWLDQQPGLQPKQREILEKAQVLYEEISRETGHSPPARFEAARAAQRLADIENKLGGIEAAERDYRRSLTVFDSLYREFPDHSGYGEALANGHLRLAALLIVRGQFDEAVVSANGAEQVAKEIRTRNPTVADNLLAHVAHFRGVLLVRSGKGDEAIEEFRLAASEIPEGRPQDLARRAASQKYLAILLGQRQAHAEADVQWQRSMALCRTLAKIQPSNPRHQLLQAELYHSLASFVLPPTETGRRIKAQLAARDILQKLVDRYPDVPEYRADLARGYMNLGVLLTHAPDRPEGMDCAAASRRGAELLHELADQFPADVEYRSTAADAWNNLANFSQPPELFKVRERELALRQGLFQQYPSNEEYRDALKACLLRTAFELMLHLPKDVVERATAIERASQTLNEHEPLTWTVRGISRCAAGNWQGAINALNRHLDPEVNYHGWELFALARSHYHGGNVAGARRLYRQAVEWTQENDPEDGKLRRLKESTAELLGIQKGSGN